MDTWSSQRSLDWLARQIASASLAVSCAAAAVGCHGNAGSGKSGQPSASEAPQIATPATPIDLPVGPIARPTPPPNDYAGSAACADCHAEICRTFAEHPMGRSAAFTPGSLDIEEFRPEQTRFSGLNEVQYQVEKRGAQVVHHEIGERREGRPEYRLSATVSMAIGSGTRGKSYAINRDGLIFMSPISWFSKDGGFFELSPGFEGGMASAHFERRMTGACLHCHVGRLAPHPTQPDRLAPPYVHEIAIGCERCHGPGKKHIERQRMGEVAVPDDSIVNPARLSARKREAVCNQCHLHGEFTLTRYGRRPMDFRPGMELEDVFLVFVNDNHVSELGASEAVSQVQQMRASVCFQSSGGKLGCATCHNPHDRESAEERVEFHRQKCLSCHAEQAWSLPAEKQRAEPARGSCIHCHMPASTSSDVAHASQTDHRILRNPDEGMPHTAAVGKGDEFDGWRLFDDAQQRLPNWEVLRARGLAMIAAVGGGKAGEHRLSEARNLLLPLTKIPLEDGTLYYGIGQSYLFEQQPREAVRYLQQAVRLEPDNDIYLQSLASASYAAAMYPEARDAIARCIALNPWHAGDFSLQANILARLGEREAALESADKALELDPNLGEWHSEILQRLVPIPR